VVYFFPVSRVKQEKLLTDTGFSLMPINQVCKTFFSLTISSDGVQIFVLLKCYEF